MQRPPLRGPISRDALAELTRSSTRLAGGVTLRLPRIQLVLWSVEAKDIPNLSKDTFSVKAYGDMISCHYEFPCFGGCAFVVCGPGGLDRLVPRVVVHHGVVARGGKGVESATVSERAVCVSYLDPKFFRADVWAA